MTDTEHHWTRVWAEAEESQTSWYQSAPEPSLSMILQRTTSADPVVDIGGGVSDLGAALAREGRSDVTVVDIAPPACERLRQRLEAEGLDVTVLLGDARTVQLPGQVAVWHDRAVLHFLTDPADVAAYATNMAATVRPGGHAVIGTFAPDGPTMCSGLPVQQYDAPSLAAAMGAAFQLEAQQRHDHTTPSGGVQHFTFVVLRRR